MSNTIPTPGIGGVYTGMEDELDEWKTPAYRARVVSQIEDEVQKMGNPTAKSSSEMENHFFQRAKNREEYLALVARVIIHMRDSYSRKEGAQGKMQQIGGGAPDPMAALQGLTMQGARPGQQGTPPPNPQQMMGGRQQHGATAGQLTMQQRQKQIQLQLQKQLSGSANSPQPQAGFMTAGPQQPGMNLPQANGGTMGQQIGQQGQMIRGQQPFKMQNQQTQQVQQMQGPGTAQHVRGQQGFKAFQQQQLQQQQLQQQQQQLQQLQQQQLQQQQLQQQQIQQQQIQQQQQLQQQRQQQNAQQRPPASPYGGYPYMMSPQGPPMSPFGSSQPFVMSPQGPPSSPYGGQHFLMSPQSMTQQPSPVSQPQSQGSQPMPSPAGYLQPSPSPQQASSLPSPAGSQRGPPSVPSPSGALSTPGNPASVGPGSVGSSGPVPSPGKAQSSTHDQQLYAEKRKQLFKYIEPLKRMINRANKDDEHRRDMSLTKMNNLLEILSNPNKKVPLSMLLQWEQILERMDLGKEVQTSQSTTAPTATIMSVTPASGPKSKNICYPLYEAVLQNIKSPTLNHTLYRTFGPTMTAIHGPPTSYPTPPAKRQKTESDSQTSGVPNIIQGEVARLASKFKVSLDETHHPAGNDVHLVCRLEDKRLPSVPPITVTVPHSYPEDSPQCDTGTQEYNQTPFLLSVQRTLVSQLKRLPDRFSFTQLLDTWEMCIRKSCLNTISA